MQNKNILFGTLILCSLFLGGCANESPQEVNVNLKYVEDPNNTLTPPSEATRTLAQETLGAVSSEIQDSLNTLSAMEMSKKKSVQLPNTFTDPKFEHQASLSWDGLSEEAVKKIAASVSYHFKIIGRRPAIPVLTNIEAKNETLGLILRNIALQSYPKATIRIHNKKRIIEFLYH